MANSINDYQLKHCGKDEDSKTRVQEETVKSAERTPF
jgi:hypothetical protein